MQVMLIVMAIVLFILAGTLLVLRIMKRFDLIPMFIKVTVIAVAVSILLIFALYMAKT
ncbi:MAG: hypothetical protein LLG37_05805 [Spirochaetia bacterium]|nr:hypothetical protein [Spirochaetia bacterium]